MNPFLDILHHLIEAWKNQPDRAKRKELAGLIIVVVCAALLYSLAQMRSGPRYPEQLAGNFGSGFPTLAPSAAPWADLNAQNAAAMKELSQWTAQMNAQNAAALQELSQWTAQQNAANAAMLNALLGNQPLFPANPYRPLYPGSW
jgi:hypothetical protein